MQVMERVQRMEELFAVLDNTAVILQEELDIPYLEALIETAENLYHQEIGREVNDLIKKRLWKEYEKIQLVRYTKEDIRKSLQLAVLKGMKEGTQQHHMMTPDAVSLFMSYLVNKVSEGRDGLSIFDPAIGTGNLMLAVLNNLNTVKDVRPYGSEVDETLIKLTYVNANLTEQPVELLHQDSLTPLLIDPVDVVISDLPVGYYPNDLQSKSFELNSDKGHAYAHHLFIEQSVKYTKPGGYLMMIVPNFLFESEEAPKLNRFLKKETVILGLLQLPSTLFKNEQQAKSILLLRKQGENVRQPEQALMAVIPSFSNKEAMSGMIQRINKWFDTYTKA